MHSSVLGGCVAVVTGCGQPDGIGFEIARSLAAEGASVVITDVPAAPGKADDSHLDELAAELRAKGSRIEPIRADVRSDTDCARTVNAALSKFGRLDILINNAAAEHGGDRRAVAQIPIADWQRVLDVNLTGAFLMARASAPAMATSSCGRIVNISSVAALRGVAKRAPYSASKAGVLGLTVSLAAELAPSGITVNAICPGSIATRRARSTAKDRLGDVDKGFDNLARLIPIGRIGTPGDIAHAVLFFVSPGASYVTGQTIFVDGGMSTLLPRI